MSDIPQGGFAVVLTADRSLMADYRTLFDGMVSASQTTATPMPVMDLLLAPPGVSDGARARRAPLGLRRIEAALLKGGFTSADVAVVNPEKLHLAVGRNTRIVALSSGDPLGLGMNTSTMTGIAGGRSYTTALFQKLLAHARAMRHRLPNLRIVVGGPGAWQLAQNAARRSLGIDHVVTGYAEADVAALFRQIINGEDVDEVVETSRSGEAIPPIRGATVMGVVEVSRGCGLGCTFCTIRHQPMMHLPMETILADVRTNLDAGVRDISLISEDLFRYGSSGGAPAPEALLELLRALRRMPEVRLIQTDHANVASVAAFSEAQLEEMHDLMSGGALGRHVWVNLGVETASGRLLESSGARAKIKPFEADEWADLCRDQVLRLIHAGFMPMASLVLGLPGETEDDILKTTEWIEAFRGKRMVVFPVFLAPLEDRAPFTLDSMSRAHWRLFESAYRFNFKWVPWMLWDEDTRARAPLYRRLATALLGRGNVMWWKMLFALKS